jgi:lipopolysaccharide biosynthesis glycosyltransferase
LFSFEIVKAAFTSATISYLPRAFTLAKSFLSHNPGYRFFIFMIDPDERITPFQHPGIQLISLEDTRVANLHELSQRLTISEISFTLKPLLALYLMEKFPNLETAFYFDADIMVYHHLAEAEKLLQTNDFVVTPHFMHPITDYDVPTELDILRTGLYNMGFAGFRISPNAKQILIWWKNRVLQFGYENHDLGLTADQMWMNLAPLLFRGVGILENPGYNFAYWNVHERVLSEDGEMVFVNDKDPLVFIHFADFHPARPGQFTNPKHFSRRIAIGRETLERLCQEYAGILHSNHFDAYVNIKSKYAQSPLQRARHKIVKAESGRERLKGLAIFLIQLKPSFLRKAIRRFSLFIIRNIK